MLPDDGTRLRLDPSRVLVAGQGAPLPPRLKGMSTDAQAQARDLIVDMMEQDPWSPGKEQA